MRKVTDTFRSASFLRAWRSGVGSKRHRHARGRSLCSSVAITNVGAPPPARLNVFRAVFRVLLKYCLY